MKTILITGASSGIGKAITEKLAPDNNLVICSRNIKELEFVRNSINNFNDIKIYKVDVCQKHTIKEMFEDLSNKKINIDILINNAGISLDLSDIKDGKPEDWDIMIDTNIKGLLYMTKGVLDQLPPKNSGHIINIGSIAGIYAYPKGSVYSATKAAVRFISDGLRKELVDRDIKVTNIQPGLVETNFSNTRFYGDTEKAKNVYKGIDSLKASDIADLVSYIITRPSHVQICEVTITPTYQASVDVIHREPN